MVNAEKIYSSYYISNVHIKYTHKYVNGILVALVVIIANIYTD